MANEKDIAVPDIGDFEGVEVIEIMVSPGDSINVEDPLVSLESDKAAMEIPVARSRCGEGRQGQHRRQGVPGRHSNLDGNRRSRARR